MDIPNASPLTHEPLAARGVLLSIAEFLHKSVAPQVQGELATRAAECVALLLRMGQEIAPADAVTTALQALNAVPTGPDALRPPIELARLEAAVLAAADIDLELAERRLTEAGTAARHFDAAGFERYLQAQPRGGPGLRITQVRQLAGGRSKITILAQQQGAVDLPADLVVRQDWIGGGVQGTTVVSEYALLKSVFAAGIKVPEPFLIEPSMVLGAPFLVVSRMAGRQQGGYFNPPHSERMVLDLAEQLARLHRLPVAAFVEAGVAPGARTPHQMKAVLDGFRAVQSRYGVPAHCIGLALGWLERNCHRIDGGLEALVHNDIGAHNLLMDGEGLTAILDWELAGIDHPAIDFGYAREWISQIVPWDRFMQRYQAAGGPEIDPLTQDFYTLWSALRVYVLLINARAAIAMGLIRDMEVVHTAIDAIPRMVRRISRELCAVLERYPA
ncbi:phosphotransferase [Hydrocarboniphaga sp.]|uniref:phosphotransferase n=1 Tax=Hydrocarboniphaga sp. TaxID=2033016 RepID=UPI0026364C32|nr:phosphotransferase [Hydrocarboniphaga sp.]